MFKTDIPIPDLEGKQKNPSKTLSENAPEL
jgi:hypothetical protein